ncbi:toxin-antitoxin system TumE family protein [Thiohalocapsa halophila]|nr:DUF6516 family protein [Thiohalocapsa halophila]
MSITSMAKAEKLLHRRQTYRGGLIEMVIWRLPERSESWPHGLKYRLVYIRDRARVIGYDNERGKGDHKHLGEREAPYHFTDVRTLLRDFWADVRSLDDD